MMKKCYALLMAIVMIVSAGSMVFAASTSGQVTDSGTWDSGISGDVETFTIEKVELKVNGVLYTATINKTVTPTTVTTRTARAALGAPVPRSTVIDPENVINAVAGTTFHNVNVDGSLYSVTLKKDGTGLTPVFDPALPKGAQVTLEVRAVGSGTASVSGGFNGLGFALNTVQYTSTSNTTDPSDATIENLSGVSLKNVILCRGNVPLPLTENDANAEKGDRNGSDGVRSGSTLYFMIKDGGYKFDNDLFWKLRVSKGTNGKYIKKISDVSKTFSKGLFNVIDGTRAPDTVGRHRYIKVELNEIYTDDEYKITLDLRLTPKQRAVDLFGIDDDAQIKVKDFHFYMKNAERAADNEWTVGTKGLMLNPLENDWNEVTYYDEDGDVAFMRFFADSDVDKFFAKLSTKWEHADYASYFNDQDAFVFNFTGSPKISSTSRCDLQIYNPFIDDDGNETIDPTTAVIYQVIDGDLYDVTDSFTYEEGDNGDMAYVCRTRFLGTYIICEKTVEEAI